MILMERKLEGYDATIQIELLTKREVQVNIVDSIGVVEWARNTKDGEEALSMYWHPFAYGYRLEVPEYVGVS